MFYSLSVLLGDTGQLSVGASTRDAKHVSPIIWHSSASEHG